MSKTKKDLCARIVLFPPSRNSGFFTFPKLFSFGAFIFFASTRKIKRNMTTEKVGGWGGRAGERLERGRGEVGEIGGGVGEWREGGGERRERGRVDFFPWHYAAKKKGGKTGRPLATGKTYTTGLHRLNENTKKTTTRPKPRSHSCLEAGPAASDDDCGHPPRASGDCYEKAGKVLILQPLVPVGLDVGRPRPRPHFSPKVQERKQLEPFIVLWKIENVQENLKISKSL